MRYLLTALAVLAILFLILPFWVFVVDERELGVVLRFGKPVREHAEPGVYFKTPFVETVERLPKTRQFWGDTSGVLLPDLPTRDDKKIELIPWAVWRVKDPSTFIERLRVMPNAERRVAQITRSAIRDVITQYDLSELVRSTDRPIRSLMEDQTMEIVPQTEAEQELEERTDQPTDDPIEVGRLKILEEIQEEARQRLARRGEDGDAIGRGIELIDVGISQIMFVDTVREKTFDRWISERESISELNISEGKRLSQAIVDETKAEVARIEGQGQKQASELRGRADAEVITQYAEAINEMGDFYSFVRTLEAYETAINRDSRIVLTTDSEFFQLLKGLQPADPADGDEGRSATEERTAAAEP